MYFSNNSEIDGYFALLAFEADVSNGIAKASITPVKVACTPDFKTHTQMAILTKMYGVKRETFKRLKMSSNRDNINANSKYN